MDDQVVAKPPGRTGRTEGGRADTAQDDAAADDAAADQAAADEARLRFRRQGVALLDPDEHIRPLLEPGEQIVAVRRSAVMYRPQNPEQDASTQIEVDVYVTSRRLILVGPELRVFDLATVDEAVVSHERLLLVLCDGVGLALEVSWPRLLRVEIAAARSARR